MEVLSLFSFLLSLMYFHLQKKLKREAEKKHRPRTERRKTKTVLIKMSVVK